MVASRFQLSLGQARGIVAALKWFCKAAEKGYADAQVNLGKLLR